MKTIVYSGRAGGQTVCETVEIEDGAVASEAIYMHGTWLQRVATVRAPVVGVMPRSTAPTDKTKRRLFACGKRGAYLRLLQDIHMPAEQAS